MDLSRGHFIRRSATLSAALALWLAARAGAAQNANEISILYNDRTVHGLRPLLLDGRVLVALTPHNVTLGAARPGSSVDNPAQRLFTAMRAGLAYDASTRTVSVAVGHLYPKSELRWASNTLGNQLFVMTTRTSTTLDALGPPTTNASTLSVPTRVVDGLVYFPLRAFAEAIGAYVAWDGASRTVVLRTAPQSQQELEAEAAQRARVESIGAKAHQSLDNAARTLR